MSQELLEFAPDADRAGFRLHELSVYNWGTFHGHPYSIHPDGRTAILTGGNGTGKSTLADALLTLLVPNRKRNYNQAGQTEKRSERNEREYVMGAHSEKHDEALGIGKKLYLRKEPGHYSVLLANFHNADLNSWVALAQVLWINTANKVEKVYIVEPRKLAIEVEFNHLQTPATFRRILREDRGLTLFDSFSAYSEKFHDLLCMPKEKTPMEIFNQAICIKDIHDLTSFIRQFMLDDGGTTEKLAALRQNFTELRDTNRRIEIATRQRDALELMHGDHEIILSLQRELQELRSREDTLAPFFAEAEIRLREALAEEQRIKKSRLETEQIRLEQRLTDLDEKIKAIDHELEHSEDGRRLKQIKTDIAAKTTEREARKEKRQAFEKVVRDWRPGLRIFDSTAFTDLHRECHERSPALKDRLREIEESETPARQIERRDLIAARDQLEAEERSLLGRTSNIPDRNLRTRAYLLDGLQLKPADLPFIGELIQVDENEAEWTGAIERLTHSFALCLVVRRELRDRVDAFVHSHRQRGLVVYHTVPETIAPPNPRLSADAVARKLAIKSGLGEIGDWLATEVSHRFDHIACPDTGPRFREAPNALTLNGLIKQRGTERRKDDRHDLNDAQQYVLGWDNREKLVAIAKELKSLHARIGEHDQTLAALKTEREEIARRLRAAESLAEHFARFDLIDWETVAKEIDDLEAERTRLESSSDRLRQLQSERATAAKQLAEAKKEEKNLIGTLALVENALSLNNADLAEARQIVATCEEAAATDERFADFRKRYPAIKDSLAFPLSTLDRLKEAREDALRAIRSRRRSVQTEVDERSVRIRTQMIAFQKDPQNEEFKDRLAGNYDLPGYNEDLFAPFATMRRHILEEDLPKNQKRFESLLHSTITDDVSIWDQLLENHAKKITAKIGELNGHLRLIDFDRREGTYIQLVPARTDEQAVREFRSIRRHALEDSLNTENDREQLKERYQRIEYLLNRLDENPEWTRRVIDVRNWFIFRADEFFRASGEHRQSYTGASGKSGGEKNRLASTILATAIAYQYGISVRNRQTETFRLVAVDEMFSKTDDEFSAYLLELFKEFHLQLLIIQPLDAKIHLVQKYVERYHIVTKRSEFSNVRTISVHEYNRIRQTP
ncbi:MAG: hypothetical protein JJT96_10715 [Opitutales bacterium]|nr:hypothetical protein [Opitutales bacterium]